MRQLCQHKCFAIMSPRDDTVTTDILPRRSRVTRLFNHILTGGSLVQGYCNSFGLKKEAKSGKRAPTMCWTVGLGDRTLQIVMKRLKQELLHCD